MTIGQQRTRAQASRDDRRGGRGPAQAWIDPAESDVADLYELPGADVPAEELELEILAQQVDEFTCSSCFLVRHRSQLARQKGSLMYCRDCEG